MIGQKKDEDKFSEFVAKWQKQSRENMAELNKEKTDYLNNLDRFESIQQMRNESSELAQKEWSELSYLAKL